MSYDAVRDAFLIDGVWVSHAELRNVYPRHHPRATDQGGPAMSDQTFTAQEMQQEANQLDLSCPSCKGQRVTSRGDCIHAQHKDADMLRYAAGLVEENQRLKADNTEFYAAMRSNGNAANTAEAALAALRAVIQAEAVLGSTAERVAKFNAIATLLEENERLRQLVISTAQAVAEHKKCVALTDELAALREQVRRVKDARRSELAEQQRILGPRVRVVMAGRWGAETEALMAAVDALDTPDRRER